MKSILLLGGTSDIAHALATKYLNQNWKVVLAGRHLGNLDLIKKDLEIRNKGVVQTLKFDALDFESHSQIFSSLETIPDVTICIFGYLGDQKLAKENWKECSKIINSNFLGAVSILNIISERYKRDKKGVIVGISSVAGDRGRESNYIYGSSKAGFSAYLSGLRSEMYKSGLHVLTVKPGFVQTKMTKDLNLPGPLTATPSQVADAIIKAIKKGKNTLYVLSVWRLIMFIITTIPEFVFKRLKL